MPIRGKMAPEHERMWCAGGRLALLVLSLGVCALPSLLFSMNAIDYEREKNLRQRKVQGRSFKCHHVLVS